jgi:acetyl esterase/lipase
LQSILDLPGASGATYRFRRVSDPHQLPASSGNFVYVRWRDAAPQVICCGSVDRLVEATRQWDAAVRAHGVEDLYVRLNIARSIRGDEHQDLTNAIRPPMTWIES